MSRDGGAKNETLKKFTVFLGMPLGKFIFGGASVIIGFFINVSVQRNVSTSAKLILGDLLKTSSSVSSEHIDKVIDGFFSPFSLSSMVFSLLWFFLGVVLADVFSRFDSEKGLSEATGDGWASDDVIVGLLNHLTEQVYNRCSNSSEHCGGCSKFASEEDGLLRRYLYEESQHLREAIEKSRDGEYSLDSNIPKFHTFAITHMMETLGAQYSVVQWIGSKPYSEQNKYDETYDALDFDFLHTLLRKVTESSGTEGGQSSCYFERELTGGRKFKIVWLLIGNMECMKNNFDYIFYVIWQLSQDNRLSMKEQADVISQFFEFYIIDEEQYKREVGIIMRDHGGSTCRRLFALENQPSFGIFGDQFMFVDSLNRASHGFIYTKKYAPDGPAQENLLDASIAAFGQILGKAEKKDFFEVLKIYEDIIAQDEEWEKQLKSIWNQNIMRGEQ